VSTNCKKVLKVREENGRGRNFEKVLLETEEPPPIHKTEEADFNKLFGRGFTNLFEQSTGNLNHFVIHHAVLGDGLE
jgi:hypothetical protein